MSRLNTTDPAAVALAAAIQNGDTAELKRLLADDPDLANVRVLDKKSCGRTPLHIAVDWPGNFPNVAETIRILAEAGADVNAPFEGAAIHRETPLHGAASCDDVAAIDALLAAGADIEAPGAVIGGGTP
jgi:ankyrin repeat protein